MPADFPRPQTNPRVLRSFALLCAQDLLSRSECLDSMLHVEPQGDLGCVRAWLGQQFGSMVFAAQTARLDAHAACYGAVSQAARQRRSSAELHQAAGEADSGKLLRPAERQQIVAAVIKHVLARATTVGG